MTLSKLNFDYFKNIHDSCDHGMRDEVLQLVSFLVVEHTLKHRQLAYHVGDDFFILQDHINK
ncbi:MAG: hypothetical protein HWE30_08470 [Methylocystaceae bacterium]|nr:hypothetical protein [Methylocystaceae bacterium]